MVKKKNLWRGLSAVMAVLLAIALIGSSALTVYATDINTMFNIPTTKIVDNGDADEDTLYYKSSFGDFTVENLEKLMEACDNQ